MKHLLSAVLAFGISATAASAAPVIGANVVVSSDGEVVATYAGAGASDNSQLWFGGNLIFDNFTSAIGDTQSLGTFSAGDILVFVLMNLSSGETYYSGAAAGNSDGVAHAAVDDLGGGVTSVGFEDLLGGGDFDYNDLVFTFTNTKGVPTVPVPAAGLLLVTGLGGVAALRRRKR